MKLKTIALLALLVLSITLVATPISIPLGANAYITNNTKGARITKDGVVSWTQASTIISSWFHLNQTGSMNLSIHAKAFDEGTIVNVTVAGQTYPIVLHSTEWTVYPVANDITIANKGHIRIDIQGVEKKGEQFAEITDLIVDGSALAIAPNYVSDFSYHFGRRGPSVHLKYTMPPQEDVEYFYNEVLVPEGQDVIGTYCMTNGFAQGYFGMQVNGETERRILFSVWSPFTTDNPKEIPEEDQITMLRRGEGVHIGEFGNEGSGGQSYLRYNWKAGLTYKFLQKIRPDGAGNTIYTAYFYATDENRWRLIASFKRPKTDTWYKGAHSFLENFSPNQGYITRKMLYGNQWVRTQNGEWIELTEAIFTYDATASAKKRVDYKGGKEGDSYFFLQNCGFFDTNTEYKSALERTANKKQPDVNLDELEQIPSAEM